MLKKFKSIFFPFFVIIAVIFLLENACQVYVRFFKPELMPKYQELQNPQHTQHTGKKDEAKFKPSPFFGYVSTEGNNYGFISDEDFPITRLSNTYVVAIFGGSVAFHLANYIFKNHDFAEQMKKAIPSLKDKDIRFMGLALPGYKQPQQYIALSYFLEHIDMVIQLDGWNEVFVSPSTSTPINYPAPMDIYDSNTLEKVSESSKFKVLIIKTIEDNSLLKKSMTLFLLKNSLEYKIFQEKHSVKIKEVKPLPNQPIFSEAAAPLVANWSKYIKQEKYLLKANNKKGFFFVQASQYNPGSKKLTAQEKTKAINPIIQELVVPKFQLIRAEAKKIDVHDLAEVFKNEKDSIYIDDCCHVNERGNKLLSEEILKVISKKYNN